MSAELAVVYAALILMEDNIEITEDKLQTLVTAAGVEIEPIWFSLYTKALAGQDLKALLLKAATLDTRTFTGTATDNNTDDKNIPLDEDLELEGSEEEFTLDIFGDF
jgi:large subunit ribosomal protein LP1